MTAMTKLMASSRLWQILFGVVLLVVAAPVLLWLGALVVWVVLLVAGALYHAVMLLWAAVLVFVVR